MKLRAIIRESIMPKDINIVVEFDGDKKKQHFQVKCEFNAYNKGMRKWDSWDVWIKWQSEIFTDPKTGIKAYFTQLVCEKAIPYCQVGNGK